MWNVWGRREVLIGFLLEEYEGMRLLGRTRRRMEDTITVYLREIGWEFVDGLIWLRTGTGGELL